MRTVQEMRSRGAKWAEIGKALGRSPHALSVTYSYRKKHGTLDEYKPEPIRSLKDYSPRELMKELYNRGYRVEGKIYYVTKQYVNVESVITE